MKIQLKHNLVLACMALIGVSSSALATPLTFIPGAKLINDRGWVATSGKKKVSLVFPDRSEFIIESFSQKELDVGDFNDEGDLISYPTQENSECVLYRYAYASKTTDRITIPSTITPGGCSSYPSIALGRNTSSVIIVAATASGTGTSGSLQGALIPASGSIRSFALPAPAPESENAYGHVGTLYFSTDGYGIVDYYDGNARQVATIDPNGTVTTITNPYPNLFSLSADHTALAGSSTSEKKVIVSSGGKLQFEIGAKGPRNVQGSSVINALNINGALVGTVSVNNTAFQEPNHAYTKLRGRDAVDLNCLFPNSIGNFTNAWGLTNNGHFLATVEVEGKAKITPLNLKTLPKHANYCAKVTARMIGGCDRYFVNSKAGTSITQNLTFPFGTSPRCTVQAKVTNSKDKPVSGGQVVLLAGSSGTETRASARTNSKGIAQLSYPINADETFSWEIRYWNDRNLRSSKVPIEVKKLY